MRRAASNHHEARPDRKRRNLPASNALSSLKSVTTTPRSLGVQNEFTLIFPRSGSWGTRSSFPLYSPSFAASGHVLGDTVGSVLQRTDPVPATCRCSTSLSINPNKDAGGFPSWWRASLLPGLLDTPSQVCLPLHDTLLPSISFHSRMGASTGVSLWVLRTIRSGYTLQLGEIPPRFDGVQLTVVNSASKASVLQQELSSLLQKVR